MNFVGQASTVLVLLFALVVGGAMMSSAPNNEVAAVGAIAFVLSLVSVIWLISKDVL